MIDPHIHILSELDDGPVSDSESLEICKLAVQNGAKALIATPHMLNGVFQVTPSKIREKVHKLNALLFEERVDLQVYPGAEIHVHADLCQYLKDREAMTLGDSGVYVLLELPSDLLPPGFDYYLYSLRLNGYTPIIAHPERNFQIQSNPEGLMDYVSSGAMLQITAGSLLGRFGGRAYKCAWKLLKMNMVHLVGSDAHDLDSRFPNLEQSHQKIKRFLGADEADVIFNERPVKIVEGEPIEVPDIRRKVKMGFLERLGLSFSNKH